MLYQLSYRGDACISESARVRKRRQLMKRPVHVGMTVWPSGLRRWLQAPVRKGVGSNPTAVISRAVHYSWTRLRARLIFGFPSGIIR